MCSEFSLNLINLNMLYMFAYIMSNDIHAQRSNNQTLSIGLLTITLQCR